jgi:hypothetical protein
MEMPPNSLFREERVMVKSSASRRHLNFVATNQVAFALRAPSKLVLTLFVLLSIPARAVDAAEVPFVGTLEILASVGLDVYDQTLLSVPIQGIADVSGSVVRIPSGEITAPVPPISGFSGTLVNGPATFSVGGAGAGSTCPLVELQEACIEGGGFGGVMRLSGVLHDGQALEVWGRSGSNPGMTSAGLSRTELARNWTEGHATAFYYILETDITPFAISATGTFRGLPASAPENVGFSLVTPMIVTSAGPSSLHNVRTLTRLRIDFSPRPVPLGALGPLVAVLVLVGLAHLRHREA